MARRAAICGTSLLALAVLAGCGGDVSDDRTLVERLTAGSFEAPEEFAVLPQKPLILPNDLTALPPPQPGTTSRADLTPNADAIRALSGRDGRAPATAADNALLAALAAGRVQPGIREILAAEDEVWRENNRGLPLDRLFGRVRERDIYGARVLDPEAELLRLRARGVLVPQLPPAE